MNSRGSGWTGGVDSSAVHPPPVRTAGALCVVICARRSGGAKSGVGLLRKVIDWYGRRDGATLTFIESDAAMADSTLIPDLVLVDLDPGNCPPGGVSGIGRWVRSGAFALCSCCTGAGEAEYSRLRALIREGAFEFISAKRLGFRGLLRVIRAEVARLQLQTIRHDEGKVAGVHVGPSQLTQPPGIAAPAKDGRRREGLLFDIDADVA